MLYTHVPWGNGLKTIVWHLTKAKYYQLVRPIGTKTVRIRFYNKLEISLYSRICICKILFYDI